MSDFLLRLVESARGVRAVAPPAMELPLEIEEEREAPPAPAAPAPPVAGALPALDPPPAAAAPPPAASPPARVSPPAPAPPPVPRAVTAPMANTASDSRAASAPRAGTVPQPAPEPAPPPEPARDLAPPASPVVAPRETVAPLRHGPLAARAVARRERPAAISSQTPVTAAPRAGSPRPAPEPPPRIVASARPPAEEVVRVSIGRIEVRAVSPPAPPAAAAAPVPAALARPRLSLDDYLAARDRRRG